VLGAATAYAGISAVKIGCLGLFGAAVSINPSELLPEKLNENGLC
jgi:hypothetical protein